MKKGGILNPHINALLASIGHTDMIQIVDAGYPIPSGIPRIDITLTKNSPHFLETLRVVLREIVVEKIILASEMESVNYDMYKKVLGLFPDGFPVEKVPHAQFKELGNNIKGVIRTGEFSPYCNIIIVAGVAF